MAQNYKVFLNESRLELEFDPAKADKQSSETNWIDCFRQMQKEPGLHLTLSFGDLAAAWRELQTHCTLIEAAGGAVLNPQGHLLMIYRRGQWDLPKGKIDPGETPRQAALREVQEECGIQKLEIVKPLPNTYHLYPMGSKFVFKPTHWFVMSHPGDEDLVPQGEEDIEQVAWVAPEAWPEMRRLTYANLRDLFDHLP